MKWDAIDVLAPLVLALLWLLMSWSYSRSFGVISPAKKRILIYVFLFLLGTLYSIAVAGVYHLSDAFWVAFSVGWAIVLGYTAWRRFQRERAASPTPGKPLSKKIAEGLPAAALLICLVMSAVMWEAWFRGLKPLYVPLLWTAGAGLSIAFAAHDRRTAVIVTLRGVLALMVIGSIAAGSLIAFEFAAALGVALLVLEKFWKDGSSLSGPGGQIPSLLGNTDQTSSDHRPN